MIAVAMGKHDGEKAWIFCPQPIDIRKRGGRQIRRIQGQPEVEQNSEPRALQLDACAPNLPRPAMNPYAHSNSLI